MILKVKKLIETAVMPRYSKPGDAGMDLVATSMTYTNLYEEYGTGLAFEIPEGFVGLLFPRSSVTNTDLILGNSVGVLDSSYRGEVKFRFKRVINTFSFGSDYKVGDRIGQLVVIPFPKVEVQEVIELSDSERGTGGYGSTGK